MQCHRSVCRKISFVSTLLSRLRLALICFAAVNNLRGEKTPPSLRWAGFQNPGDDLLSRCSHYHRPWMLNGRVRNGNGCGHPNMVTGKTPGNREENRENSVSSYLSPAMSEIGTDTILHRHHFAHIIMHMPPVAGGNGCVSHLSFTWIFPIQAPKNYFLSRGAGRCQTPSIGTNCQKLNTFWMSKHRSDFLASCQIPKFDLSLIK